MGKDLSGPAGWGMGGRVRVEAGGDVAEGTRSLSLLLGSFVEGSGLLGVWLEGGRRGLPANSPQARVLWGPRGAAAASSAI